MSLWKTLSTCPLFYDIHQVKWKSTLSIAESVNTTRVRPFMVKKKILTTSLQYLKESTIARNSEEGMKDIQVLGKGGFYGEHFLFSDMKKTEILTVEENTKVLEVPFQALQEVFEKDPLIYGIFITNLSYLVLKKFEIAQNIVFRVMEEPNNTIRVPLYDDTTIRKAYSRDERDKFLKKMTKQD